MQAIADAIGFDKSTVSRDIKRGNVSRKNTYVTVYQAYFTEAGQANYEKNRSHCETKYKLVEYPEFINFPVNMMQEHNWSPNAVCRYAKASNLFEGGIVYTKTHYHYIDSGMLPIESIDLPLKVMRSTKKKHLRKNKRILGKIIEERPKHIEDRTEFGHWEIDTVLGNRTKGNALLT